MADRLAWLLEHFELRARVFHSGALTCGSTYEPTEGIGYIHLLHEGAVSVENDGEPAYNIAQPGVLMYLNPTHTRISPVSDTTRIVCASFEFGLGGGNPLQSALPSMHHSSFADVPGLANVLRQIEFEAEEHHCGRQSVLNRLCEVALVLVLRDLMDRKRLDIGLLAGLADAKLQKALMAMHAQPERDWSLPQLGAMAGMSRARFAVRFREVVGVTPVAYLASWRIGLAKSLLLQDKSISVIAQEVGYSSASAFSRAFQSQCSASPRAWLQQRRNS